MSICRLRTRVEAPAWCKPSISVSRLRPCVQVPASSGLSGSVCKLRYRVEVHSWRGPSGSICRFLESRGGPGREGVDFHRIRLSKNKNHLMRQLVIFALKILISSICAAAASEAILQWQCCRPSGHVIIFNLIISSAE